MPTRRKRKGTARAIPLAAGALLIALSSEAALAQACPAALAVNRLVLVTAETMNTPQARMQMFARPSPRHAWQAVSKPEPAVIGRAGMGWSHFFGALAQPGEPIKAEGDKRAPAGVYRMGRSFGTVPSSRPGHLQVRGDTVCVDDLSSPDYNTITSRKIVGPKVRGEDMSRMQPMYRRGILVDYPTNARARAGSCIFVHVWQGPGSSTSGCIALPEERVVALQDFAQQGAAIAILPRAALQRLQGCLPSI